MLLSTMGFYGVFVGLKYRNDIRMSKALHSGEYAEEITITFKIPMSIPYVPDQVDFVSVDDKFEHNGELYRMIKRKYASDTLTVVCMTDPEYKKINLALTTYLKTFTQQEQESQQTAKAVNFIKDYLPSDFSIITGSAGWSLDLVMITPSLSILSEHSTLISQPPEHAV